MISILSIIAIIALALGAIFAYLAVREKKEGFCVEAEEKTRWSITCVFIGVVVIVAVVAINAMAKQLNISGDACAIVIGVIIAGLYAKSR